jgi:hypothetical protein
MRDSGQVGFLASPDGTPRQGESPDESRDSSTREQQLTLALPGLTQWIVWGALGLGGAYVLTKLAESLLNPEDVVANPAACPLTRYSYGGISEGGGFGSSTEYEIGARRIVEACRCILGELGKGALSSKHSRAAKWFDAAHMSTTYLEQKVTFVVEARREYARPLYNERMVPVNILEMGYLDPDRAIESARESVYSIRKSAIALGRQAARRGSELSACDLPKEVTDVAFWCYALLEALAEAMLDGVEDFPDNVTNPFDKNRVVAAAYMLDQAAEKFFAAIAAVRRH